MPLEQGPPTRIHQDSGENSWIAQEREAPGNPTWWFVVVALAMGAAVLIATITLGSMRGDASGTEALHEASETPFGRAIEVLGVEGVRALSGIVAGGAVTATAFAGRRIAHSNAAGLAAGALMAFDTSVLLEGQLATTASFLRFAGIASLALALAGHRAWHWVAAAPIALGIALEPWFILWGGAIAAVLWLRGHIYSAPKHLGRALLQGAVIPAAVGALFHVVAFGIGNPNPVDCVPAHWGDAMLLRSVAAYGLAPAIPNPVTWYGGGGLLLALAAGSLVVAATRFRITRAPGRIQLRLDEPLGRLRGRSIWLLVLAAAAPTPAVLLPIAAITLGLAVHHLLKDSLAFGGAIAGAILLFAALYLVRFAVMLDPSATEAEVSAVLQLMPWAEPTACRP